MVKLESGTCPTLTIAAPRFSAEEGAVVVKGTVAADSRMMARLGIEVYVDEYIDLGRAKIVYRGGDPAAWRLTLTRGAYPPGEHKFTVLAKRGNAYLWGATLSGPDTVVPLSAVHLLSEPTSPTLPEVDVRLAAVVVGGTSDANMEYKFEVDSAELQGYSSSNTCLWTVPSTAGAHTLKAYAREAGDPGSEVVCELPYDVRAAELLSGVTLTADPPSPQSAFTKIRLIASSAGGAWVEYRLEENGRVIQDYCSSPVFYWGSATPGTYDLKVTAREAGTTEPVFTAEILDYEITPAPLDGVSLETSHVSPQTVGTDIVLSAIVRGGTNVEYRFEVYDADSKLIDHRDYSTRPTWGWRPTSSGKDYTKYTLKVLAREVGTTEPVFTCKQGNFMIVE